jgi:hypothetical protein
MIYNFIIKYLFTYIADSSNIYIAIKLKFTEIS